MSDRIFDSRCRIIIAEDLEFGILDPPNSHLCKQRKKITWSTERVLADEA